MTDTAHEDFVVRQKRKRVEQGLPEMITDERVHRLLAGLIGKPRHSRKAEDTRD